VTALVWDQVGERIYQAGVDHGVLYLHDGTVAVWNGLTDVEEATSSEVKSFYLDGVKYLENLSPNDFAAKLKAFTYPDEFELVNGVRVASGLVYYDQPAKSFNLSYRTRIGNDLEGIEYGYKIHILYNIIADPDSFAYSSLTDSGAQVVEFSWSLTGTPPKIAGYRPTVHIAIDSTKTPPEILQILETQLYGTETSEPRLPSIIEVAEYFGYLGALLIVDHGDGNWSAIDESDTYITMLDATTFQIDDADVTYLDSDTYQISSTNIGIESRR
jgi:hypothetical protein